MFLKTRLSRSFACRQNCALMCCRLTALARVSLVTPSLFFERETWGQRERFTVKGVCCPRLFLWSLGLRDPLHLSVMSPWSDPLLLQGRMGVTKRGPIPLRNELIFRTAGFPGFLMYPVSWLQRVKGQVVGVGSTWLPYFMRVFTISSTWRACLSCSISRGLRCPFSQSWVWHTPVLMNLTLTYPLGITARAGQSEAT